MQKLTLCYPGGRRRALTLSYDDGVEQDQKLLSLMEQHGVKGTFNLNSGSFAEEGHVYPAGTIHRRMSLSQCLKLYDSPNAEVAVHGYTHSWLNLQPTEIAMEEILRDRRELERLFGVDVRGSAYPYGAFNDNVVDILRLAGIRYARTTVSRENFAIPTDWLRMGATCHHNNPRLMELAQRFLNDSPRGDGPLFYLWGHSYEFEANDNWNVIENFLDTVSGNADVWYATNIEVYDYVTAWRALDFSADGMTAINRTQFDLWAETEKGTVHIPAGAAKRIG